MTRAVFRKELAVLWLSPLPWVAGAVMHAALGTLAWGQIASRGQAVFQPVVPIAGFLLLVVAPVLTARTVADEASKGTLDLLLAARVPVLRLVVGKYLAVAVTLALILSPGALLVSLLFVYGDPDPGPVITGIVGLGLMAGATAAVGLAASSLTESQPVAAVGSMSAVLVLWFAHSGAESLPTGVLAFFSISERLRSFAGGLLDPADIAFFIAVAVVSLTVAVRAIEHRRLR